ncbi:MAG: SUMF1/EgtB/PvdO family nonheme iron enzyme [Gemmatimonadota bacterium]|nr:SUMF1/EgtB/PvdO family nonheme iron enzyme [Gemmatimonadota bacterium]MDH5549303.1 SUMF1/EgtB/PvdO family nonheme iron enzyme [Gemmatimonadota bacterium]
MSWISRAVNAVRRLLRRPYAWGLATGIVLVAGVRGANDVTSTDTFCGACHVHPQATTSWRLSTHYATKSGTVVQCVECHLPPGGVAYAAHKTRLAVRDVVGTIFREQDSLFWEERSQLEHATTFVFGESCVACHPNLFPVELTDKGEEAHLHYENNVEEIPCIKCHMQVGHFDPDAEEIDFGLVAAASDEVYEAPAIVEGFTDYTEYIPGTTVSFEMVAIPGGTFRMGSPESEPYRRADEGPVHSVAVDSVWMGRIEVTWDEFEAWYRATRSEGRSDTRLMEDEGVDAITGATPPYVPPDQGWGKGDRPAITMTYHAAEQYCRWLSQVTGKHYRLPTEAEWEYAARGGSDGPYFFEGSPTKYTERRWRNRVLGRNTVVLDSFVIHRGNSNGRTQPPSLVTANPFGLRNMLGNVREFTADWYAADTYERGAGDGAVPNPRGPDTGTERVVRGGSFRSDPADVRSAARDHTRSRACFMTDPQVPKSRWWYSDCLDIGLRVVRAVAQPSDEEREREEDDE